MHSIVRECLLKVILYAESIFCEFPSPAEGHQETLELEDYLIRHPNATFFLRACGESMVGAGIYDGDLLVVDCAEEINLVVLLSPVFMMNSPVNGWFVTMNRGGYSQRTQPCKLFLCQKIQRFSV